MCAKDFVIVWTCTHVIAHALGEGRTLDGIDVVKK